MPLAEQVLIIQATQKRGLPQHKMGGSWPAVNSGIIFLFCTSRAHSQLTSEQNRLLLLPGGTLIIQHKNCADVTSLVEKDTLICYY